MAALNLPTIWNFFVGTSGGNVTLNASNAGVGAVYRVGKTETITKIGVPWFNRTSPPTYRVGLESVTTRLPSGTYLASGSAYVDVAAPANGATWHTLATPAPVTVGDVVAPTVRYQSGTIGGSNNIIVVQGYSAFMAIQQSGPPYGVAMSGGTWSVGGTIVLPGLGIQYSDGTVERLGCFCNVGINSDAWNSGSSPIYRGAGWTPNVTCVVDGFWIALSIASDAADFNIRIYEGSNTTPILTIFVDADKDIPSTANRRIAFISCAATTFTAGITYRFVVEPTTANNVTWNYPIFPDAASLAGYAGELFGTVGTATPVWTDYLTSSWRVHPIIPRIASVSAGGGYGRSESQ